LNKFLKYLETEVNAIAQFLNNDRVLCVVTSSVVSGGCEVGGKGTFGKNVQNTASACTIDPLKAEFFVI